MTSFHRGDRVKIIKDPYYVSISGNTYPQADLFPASIGDTVVVKTINDHNLVVFSEKDESRNGWLLHFDAVEKVDDDLQAEGIPQGNLKDGSTVRVITDEPTYFGGGVRHLHTSHKAMSDLCKGNIVTLLGNDGDDDDYQNGNYIINDEWLISKDDVEEVVVTPASEREQEHAPKDDRPMATPGEYREMANALSEIEKCEHHIDELQKKINLHKATIENRKKVIDTLREKVRF